jgi:hypothetical protein
MGASRAIALSESPRSVHLLLLPIVADDDAILHHEEHLLNLPDVLSRSDRKEFETARGTRQGAIVAIVQGTTVTVTSWSA